MRFGILALALAIGGSWALAEPPERGEDEKHKKGGGKDGRDEGEERRKKDEEEERRRAEAELNWDRAGKNGGVSWQDVPDVDAMVESAQKAKCPDKGPDVGGEPKPGIAGYEKEPPPLDEGEIEEAVDGSFGEEEGDASWLERK
jgi:hypothetical protein